MFCKTCLSHHCASITPSSSSTESTAIQRRRKKNKEGKKPTQLSLKIDFSLKKKKSCATVDGHSAQFLPYDSQLQLIFIKAFTDTQKKIVHHKMEEDDIDVSCSLTGWHQHQPALLKRRFYANIMPKIIGQMKQR